MWCAERPINSLRGATISGRHPSEMAGGLVGPSGGAECGQFCEIELCGSTETNAPFPLGHQSSFFCAGDDLFGETSQITLQIVDGVEFLELTSIQRAEADIGRFPQKRQLCRVLPPV